MVVGVNQSINVFHRKNNFLVFRDEGFFSQSHWIIVLFHWVFTCMFTIKLKDCWVPRSSIDIVNIRNSKELVKLVKV